MVDKHVRMAEAKTENSDSLMSEGVGSCVVVCLRDSENNVGGMAHVVLPSKKMSNGSQKYADNILENLL
jgi:chemotaxis protein CheD